MISVRFLIRSFSRTLSRFHSLEYFGILEHILRFKRDNLKKKSQCSHFSFLFKNNIFVLSVLLLRVRVFIYLSNFIYWTKHFEHPLTFFCFTFLSIEIDCLLHFILFSCKTMIWSKQVSIFFFACRKCRPLLFYFCQFIQQTNKKKPTHLHYELLWTVIKHKI